MASSLGTNSTIAHGARSANSPSTIGSGTLRPIARWWTRARASTMSASARSSSERRSRPAQPMPGLGLATSRMSGRMSVRPSVAELAVVALGRGRVDVQGDHPLAGVGRDPAVAAGVRAEVPRPRARRLADERLDEARPCRPSRRRRSACGRRSRPTRCRPAPSAASRPCRAGSRSGASSRLRG